MEVDKLIHGRYNDVKFSDITDRLDPVAHLIEGLTLSCVDIGDGKNLSHLRPLKSLQQFAELKRLSIPQGLIIDTTGLDIPIPRPLDSVPPKLKYLCVYDPTLAIVEWLSGILDDRGKLRNPKTVLLDFEWNWRNRVSGLPGGCG
jgi:hypothetical protein